MNLIRKIIITFLPVMLVAMVVVSCKDDSKSPIVTFDDAGKGAYIKSFTSNQTGIQLVNILTQADYDASQFGFSVDIMSPGYRGAIC